MRLRAIAFLALAPLLLASCGGGDTRARISTKRVGLDLAFKTGGNKQKTIVKKRVVVVQPAINPSGIVPRTVEGFRPPPPIVAPQAACPTASPTSGVGEPVTVAVHTAPKAGIYGYQNEGEGEVSQGTNPPFPFPYPPYTERVIQNVKTTEDGYTFEIFANGLSPGSSTTIFYAITPTALEIRRIDAKSSEGTSTIRPTPPVTVMVLGRGVGATWNTVGVDTDSGTVMQTEGSITKRELVDVCGKLYDTFRVESKETFFNSLSGYRYATDDDHPTVYNVATQFGAIVLREDVKATATLPTSGGIVTLRLDYDGVVLSKDPRPA